MARTVLHNPPSHEPGLLGKIFKNTAANLAAVRDAVLPAPPTPFGVTHSAGKRGQPFRRYIAYKQRMVHRQIGIAWRNGECLPRIQIDIEHSFLHATKGWRTFHRIPRDLQIAMAQLQARARRERGLIA